MTEKFALLVHIKADNCSVILAVAVYGGQKMSVVEM